MWLSAIVRCERVHELARAERIALKRHMLLRMEQRRIQVEEIKEVLSSAVLVEDYSGDKPLPSALLLGYTKSRRPLHLVVALDDAGEMLWVLTGYEPDPLKWEKGWKKRRLP